MINHTSIIDTEETVNREVSIKLLGVFRKAYGNNVIKLKIERNVKLKEIIRKLADSSENLRRVLIDPELESPLPNAVILLNGRDISSLHGLETQIKNGDEILLIPVVHGG